MSNGQIFQHFHSSYSLVHLSDIIKEASSYYFILRGVPMRRTKIVCTIGPATNSEERLEQLIRSGMNVAWLNFSLGTQREHALVIERLRTISARLGCSIAILQDLQGPKIRTGTLQG